MNKGGIYAVANGTDNFQLGDLDQDVDSDDSKDDSDAVQLFELPKRKLVRPMSSSLRRKIRPVNKCWQTTKECCRVFVTVTLPMLIAVFIVSTILCLTFLLVGIAGMKQEISMLKLRLKNVDAAERSFMGKKEQLRKEFQNKLNNIVSYQTELVQMKKAMQILIARLSRLNTTVNQFHAKPTTEISTKIAVLQHDIDTLKTGMADTGADIEKLKATGSQLQKDYGVLNHYMKDAKLKMYNMTVQISEIEHKPPPPMTTTPKTLVVTVQPDQEKPPSRKELKSILAELEKKQTDTCKKEVALYGTKLAVLRNETLIMNKTYFKEVSYLRHYLLSMKAVPPTVQTSLNTTLPANRISVSTNSPTKALHMSYDVNIASGNSSITLTTSPSHVSASSTNVSSSVGSHITSNGSLSSESSQTHSSLTTTPSLTTNNHTNSTKLPTTSQSITTKRDLDTTTNHSTKPTLSPIKKTTHNLDRRKRQKLSDIKSDEILEEYEPEKNRDFFDTPEPLLKEYVKGKDKMSTSNSDLDSIDNENSV